LDDSQSSSTGFYSECSDNVTGTGCLYVVSSSSGSCSDPEDEDTTFVRNIGHCSQIFVNINSVKIDMRWCKELHYVPFNIVFTLHLTLLSRYSDSLWAGRSGGRIPVGTRFSALVQTHLGAHPTSYTMGIGSLSWG